MPKKDQHLTIHFPPLTLYFNDLKKITNILEENCVSFRIQTKGTKYDSSEALKELHEDKIYELKISSSNPSIEINFSKSEASLFSLDNDARSSSIVSRIKMILWQRIYRLNTFTTLWFWPIIAIIIILSFPYIFPDGEYLLWQGILGGLTIFVLICGMLLKRRYHSTIHLSIDKKKKSFFY